MAGNKAICYKAVQVVYRNSVVSHIRNTLTVRVPDQSSLVKDVLGEARWAEAKAVPEKAMARSGLAISPSDDFDFIGVEHFSLFLGKYFGELCPVPRGIDKAIWRASKKQLLDWVDSVREARNVISHPNSEDLDFADSFQILDCCRRILEKLDLTDAAQEVGTMVRELDGYAFVEGTSLESSLPNPERIVVGFVGRHKELGRLRDWFFDPNSRHWLLAGDGGKGKSALAYQFACAIKEQAPRPFQAVAWLSAKKRQFQEGKVGILPQPDFSDLDSALSRILMVYGFDEEVGSDIDVKRSVVKDLLNNLPALLIVDDVDTIDTRNENVIDFFQSEVALTKSKVLFTARRTLFGMGGTMTLVEGLKGKDGDEFVKSRQRLMGIETELEPNDIAEILKITEGSPLYITDLIRLMRFMSVQDALSAWAKRGGQEARRFALGRELELLSREANRVLVAAAIASGTTSRAELSNITGFPDDEIVSALHELNKLFLSPRPRLVEGEERYEISENVRLLVRDLQGGTDLFKQMEGAYRAVSGQLPRIRDPKINAIVRQAVFKVRQNEHSEAKVLLENALDRFPNHPALVGFLGWVYKTWDPPHITEAREAFVRADALGSQDAQMYRHWAEMEGQYENWNAAAEVAERGLGKQPKDKDLRFLAGYSRTRRAKFLLRSAQTVGAREELMKARSHLESALTPVEQLLAHGRALNTKVYRALVIACEELGLSDDLYRYFGLWKGEHPDDPTVESERERLSHKFLMLRR